MNVIPTSLLDALELDLHLLAQLEVERAERLVEEQDPGPVDERPGEGDALALAARELAGLAPLVAARGGPSRSASATRAAALGLGDLADHQPVADVVADGHVREQRVVLEDGVDVALERRLACVTSLAVEQDPALGRQLEAGDHPQRRRLARARTGRASRRTRRRAIVEVDAGDRLDLAEDACATFSQPARRPEPRRRRRRRWVHASPRRWSGQVGQRGPRLDAGRPASPDGCRALVGHVREAMPTARASSRRAVKPRPRRVRRRLARCPRRRCQAPSTARVAPAAALSASSPVVLRLCSWTGRAPPPRQPHRRRDRRRARARSTSSPRDYLFEPDPVGPRTAARRSCFHVINGGLDGPRGRSSATPRSRRAWETAEAAGHGAPAGPTPRRQRAARRRRPARRRSESGERVDVA